MLEAQLPPTKSMNQNENENTNTNMNDIDIDIEDDSIPLVVNVNSNSPNSKNQNQVPKHVKMHMHEYGSSIVDQVDYDRHFSRSEQICTVLAWLVTWMIPLCWCGICKTIQEYERALIFRLGKIKGKPVGPGLFIVNPLVDTVQVVDTRVVTCNLQPQAMMTKDSVTVTVDAIVFLKVVDPCKAILEVDDYLNAFRNFSATTLRSVVGTFDLDSLLSERDIINENVRHIIAEETRSWGVTVPGVEIKDVSLPKNMQRAMAAEAEAERERRAKIISAAGEAQAAIKLAEAADIISQSDGALQLRYLHTLVKISAEKNSTILFPLPIEIMKGIQGFQQMAAAAAQTQQNQNSNVPHSTEM